MIAWSSLAALRGAGAQDTNNANTTRVSTEDFKLRMWFGSEGLDRYTCTDNSAEASRRGMQACLETFAPDRCGWTAQPLLLSAARVGNATCDGTDVVFAGGYLEFEGSGGAVINATQVQRCVPQVIESKDCLEYMQVVYYPDLASLNYRSAAEDAPSSPTTAFSEPPTPAPSSSSETAPPTASPTTQATEVPTALPSAGKTSAPTTFEPTLEPTEPEDPPTTPPSPSPSSSSPTAQPPPPTAGPTVATNTPPTAPPTSLATPPPPSLRPTAAASSASDLNGIAAAPGMGPGEASGNSSSTSRTLPMAVGAGVAGLLLIALLVGLERRRRQRQGEEDDDSDADYDSSTPATTIGGGFWGRKTALSSSSSSKAAAFALSPVATLALSEDELLGEYRSELDYDLSPVGAERDHSDTTAVAAAADGAEVVDGGGDPQDVDDVPQDDGGSLHSYDTETARGGAPGNDLRLMAMIEVDTESVEFDRETDPTDPPPLDAPSAGPQPTDGTHAATAPPVVEIPASQPPAHSEDAAATCLDAADCTSWTRRSLFPRPFAALYGNAPSYDGTTVPPQAPACNTDEAAPKSDYDPDPSWNPDDASVRSSDAGEPFGAMRLVSLTAAPDGTPDEGGSSVEEGLSTGAVAPPPSVGPGDAPPHPLVSSPRGFFGRRRSSPTGVAGAIPAPPRPTSRTPRAVFQY